ncbi:aldehyde dehydrogenase family protein [Sesbania bispinosa]|nr:aldehyde dehydrogenase family protein [Sesbania bispinosa]
MTSRRDNATETFQLVAVRSGEDRDVAFCYVRDGEDEGVTMFYGGRGKENDVVCRGA